MPIAAVWNRVRFDTPAIHPCTIRDFFDLFAAEDNVAERPLASMMPAVAHPGGGFSAGPIYLANSGFSCGDTNC